MLNSKRSIATAEIAIHFFITAAFTMSYDSSHDFAGKGMLNVLNTEVIFAVLEL